MRIRMDTNTSLDSETGYKALGHERAVATMQTQCGVAASGDALLDVSLYI